MAFVPFVRNIFTNISSVGISRSVYSTPSTKTTTSQVVSFSSVLKNALTKIESDYTLQIANQSYANISNSATQYLSLFNIVNNQIKITTDSTVKLLLTIAKEGLEGAYLLYGLNNDYQSLMQKFNILENRIQLILSNQFNLIINGVVIIILLYFMSINGDNGPVSSALFNTPTNMAYDPSGILYITDFSNNEIRKIDMTTLFITSLIGNGMASSIGNGGLALNATTFTPYGIIIDSFKNIFFSEYSTGNIRKIDPSGNVNYIHNTGSFFNYGLAFDISHNLLIGASGYIYKLSLDSSGIISSHSSLSNYSHLVGQAYGISVDSRGNIWVAGKSGGVQQLSYNGLPILYYSSTGGSPLFTKYPNLTPSYVYPLSDGNIIVLSYAGYILKITPGIDSSYGMISGSTTSVVTLLAGSTTLNGNSVHQLFYYITLCSLTQLLFMDNDGYLAQNLINNMIIVVPPILHACIKV